jgi:transcription initiation factor TFIID subunit TAF12
VFGVSSDEYLNYAMINRRKWEAEGEAITATMIHRLQEASANRKAKRQQQERQQLLQQLQQLQQPQQQESHNHRQEQSLGEPPELVNAHNNSSNNSNNSALNDMEQGLDNKKEQRHDDDVEQEHDNVELAVGEIIYI